MNSLISKVDLLGCKQKTALILLQPVFKFSRMVLICLSTKSWTCSIVFSLSLSDNK